MHTPEAIKGTVLLIDRAERLAGERQLFEGEGLRVMTATTAKEGLAAARAETPDLVVSEVMLEKPDSGFVLGYRMKQDPALKAVPLLLVSSIFESTATVFDLSSPESRQWIKADMYLERPVPPERLLARVRALLR